MPADLTRSETKHAVYETTTCCACSEYFDYELPEAGSEMISKPRYQIAHAKSGITKLYHANGSST